MLGSGYLLEYIFHLIEYLLFPSLPVPLLLLPSRKAGAQRTQGTAKDAKKEIPFLIVVFPSIEKHLDGKTEFICKFVVVN